MKKRWIVAGLGLIGCAWGTGLIDSERVAAAVTVGGVVLVAGGLLGGLAGAGYARERRAWHDYQGVRAQLPVARRAWLEALGQAAGRLVVPVAVLAALAWWWWEGRR